MGLVRGNPVTLVALFFGAAVFLTGGLYAYFPIAMKNPDLVSVTLVSALGFSLLLTMAILVRIFWVTARNSSRSTRAR
jgi:formate/nitrite transporter FocA (FNT family)